MSSFYFLCIYSNFFFFSLLSLTELPAFRLFPLFLFFLSHYLFLLFSLPPIISSSYLLILFIFYFEIDFSPQVGAKLGAKRFTPIFYFHTLWIFYFKIDFYALLTESQSDFFHSLFLPLPILKLFLSCNIDLTLSGILLSASDQFLIFVSFGFLF